MRTARRPRIHTFLATSDVHLQHKLRATRAEALVRIKEMVGHARSLCADVEFSPEDATRSDEEFLFEALRVAVAAGATTLNIPDTVGYTTPEEYGRLIGAIPRAHALRGGHLGALPRRPRAGGGQFPRPGLMAGARQAEVTINGIGERAGNAALEEVVMALATRRARFGLENWDSTPRSCAAPRCSAPMSGMVVAQNKAIVGANAFAHEWAFTRTACSSTRRPMRLCARRRWA